MRSARVVLSVTATATAALTAHLSAARAADRPYTTPDGATVLLGGLAVYQPDHLFWSLTSPEAPARVFLPCPDGGGAVMRRFASADGQTVWALADLPRDPNVGDVESPGAKHPTVVQTDVCPAMEAQYAAQRDSGPGYPAATLLRSADSGHHWQLVAVVPSPDGYVPTAEELDLQLAEGAVRVGSPQLGWSTYGALGRPLALWQQQGVSYGILRVSGLPALDPQASQPGGLDQIASRRLDDGSAITVWASPTRVQTLHGLNGVALARTTSSPSFRVKVRPGNYGCPTPQRFTVRGFDQVLPAPDGRTLWGMTRTVQQVPCSRSSLHTTLSFRRVLVRSSDSGRTWKPVKAPADLGSLVAADKTGLVAGFVGPGCDGLIAGRLTGRSWRTFGCRPLSVVGDQ